VESLNGVNNLELVLTIGEGITSEAEGKRLFEATKTLSKHGNYKSNPHWEAETVSAGDNVLLLLLRKGQGSEIHIP
jgi:hypothetical protein